MLYIIKTHIQRQHFTAKGFERDMFRKSFLFSMFVLGAVLTAACQTDYSGRAADEAREYVLENIGGLNEEQRHFIRYTQPELYSNLIFPAQILPLSQVDRLRIIRYSKLPTAPQQDIMHHCFVWSPPGLSTKVVVVGDGERSLRFWSPIRVLLKNYIPASVDYQNAKNAAIAMARSSMKFLTQAEINRIRFSEPEVVYTCFPLTWSVEDNTKELTPWEEYLKDMAEQRQEEAIREGKEEELILTQLSLVWRADKAGECVVFSGFSTKGCLNDWRIQTSGYMPESEIVAGTLPAEEVAKIVKTPGIKEGKQVFPREEKAVRGNEIKETGSIFGGNIKY